MTVPRQWHARAHWRFSSRKNTNHSAITCGSQFFYLVFFEGVDVDAGDDDDGGGRGFGSAAVARFFFAS